VEGGICGCTRLLGVFGHPVEHSLSPAMHNAAIAALGLPYVYVPFAVRPQHIGPAIRSLVPLGIVGVNLTIPHKEAVLPHLDWIAPEARDLGAVNTVHHVDGRLLGYNTDGEGFAGPLRSIGFDVRERRVVVLGAGGASRSVVDRLARDGARVCIANRTLQRAERLAGEVRSRLGAAIEVVAWDDAERLSGAVSGCELLVNTTSLGMSPNVDAIPPFHERVLRRGMLVYDLVYRPLDTCLLSMARAAGADTLSGVGMLVAQGAAALRLWTGADPDASVMERAVLAELDRDAR
jgi:shikimate dehydrogenase